MTRSLALRFWFLLCVAPIVAYCTALTAIVVVSGLTIKKTCAENFRTQGSSKVSWSTWTPDVAPRIGSWQTLQENQALLLINIHGWNPWKNMVSYRSSMIFQSIHWFLLDLASHGQPWPTMASSPAVFRAPRSGTPRRPSTNGWLWMMTGGTPHHWWKPPLVVRISIRISS